jgi:NAD+ kinase
MQTLGITANTRKPRAAVVLKRLADRAASLGLELLTDEGTAALLEGAAMVSHTEMFARMDALVALGGDGTMLRAVRELGGLDKPVMGVNIGSLGFLTSVAEEDLERSLECLAADDYVLSENALADCRVEREGQPALTYRALNDVVVSRASARVVMLDVSVDGDLVTTYTTDGVVVSTPSGSTGHSLSAGGPIMSPATSAFVISLICPHTLSSRPLVVPDASRIVITPVQETGPAVLAVDGQLEQALAPGDCVRVCRSETGVRFIRLPGYSYFGVLRQKLHWRGSSV